MKTAYIDYDDKFFEDYIRGGYISARSGKGNSHRRSVHVRYKGNNIANFVIIAKIGCIPMGVVEVCSMTACVGEINLAYYVGIQWVRSCA